MAQHVKRLTAKPDNLISNPRTHKVERLTPASCALIFACVHLHTHLHTHKINTM